MTSNDAPIRVLMAEDQEYLREGISRILVEWPELKLVGSVKDGTSALEQALALRPDVVLLDIRMPELNGIEVAERLRLKQPEIGLLLLSQYDDHAYIQRFLGNDPTRKGYLLKSTLGQVESLVQAIKAVAAGQLVLDPQLTARLIERPSFGLEELTLQERRVLAAIAEGYDNQAIAKLLTIEKGTVENHINSIYSKLGIGSESGLHRRVQAVLRFLRSGQPPV